jgi:hypothetical protein
VTGAAPAINRIGQLVGINKVNSTIRGSMLKNYIAN